MKILRLSFILVLFMILIIMAITVSAASNADFRYQLDQQGTAVTTVVKDVPFSVDMEMSVSSDNPNNNVRDLLLHTSGTGFGAGEPVFVSGTRGAWLPSAGNPDQNRLLSGNIRQYMFTAAHGTVDTTKDTFRKVMQLEVKATTSGQITLASAGVTNIVGGNIETFTIGTIIPLAVDPQNSRCNDRVVGYIDANNNGRKDAGELNEACDDGNTNPNDGCSATCTYVDLGYSCTNTNFGDRNSVCTRLLPGQFFVEKMKALLVERRCYPSDTHPDKLYSMYCDIDPNNNNLLRNEVINLVLDAVNQLLNSLFPGTTSPSIGVIPDDCPADASGGTGGSGGTDVSGGTACSSVGDLFAGLDQNERITLCTSYGITAATCPGTSEFSADINNDDLIDDRDALFIFQAIEAKQSVYNYCGAVGQPPCVFGDRAICEDVSYVWTVSTSIVGAPALPTAATSSELQTADILCGNLVPVVS